MQSGRVLAIISLIVPLTLPAVVGAQGSSGVQVFTSYDNSFPGGAGLAGFGLSLAGQSIGVRGTFGVTLSTLQSTSAGVPPANTGQWTSDVDLVFANNLFGLGNLLGGVIRPYGFAGLGAHSVSDSPTLDAAVKTWSYGGGIAVPISPTLAIDGEYRNRSALGTSALSTSDFVNGTEFRVGLSFAFGRPSSTGSRRGSSSSSRPPSGPSSGGRIWPASNLPASAAARRVIPDAEQYLGVPYVYGGSTPNGFDCSGLVQYVYAHEGVIVPRTSRQQAGVGLAIDPSPQSMTVGDLLFFAQGGEISHVAIYAGAGRILHSSSSGSGVRYDDLSTQRGRWFADHLVAVRRVATGSSAAAAASFARSVIAFDHFDAPDSAPPPRKP